MKKIGALILVSALAFSLAACGGGNGGASSNEPNVGKWNAVSVSMFGVDMDMTDLFENGVTLEVKANGKFDLVVDGDKGSGNWEYAGSALKMTASGVEMSATVAGGMLTLTDLLGMGLDITFEKVGGYDSGAAAPSTAASAPAAGAGGTGSVQYYRLESGTEDGETVTGDELRAMGLDYYVVLNADGTALFQTDNTVTGTWADGVMHLTGADGAQEDLPFTLDGGTLTIESDGLKMVFALSSEAPPASPPATTTAPGPATGNLNALQQWWNGDWYGYIYLSTADGAWESLEDGVWDCFGTIDSDAAGAGSIFLWDDGGELANVQVQITEYGVSDAGVAMSESGSFNKMAMGHADWIIDPGTNTQAYEHLIIIDGSFEDPDGSEYGGFTYEIWLRPWGMRWDDAAKEDLPPGYDNWYLDRYTVPMPTMSELLGGAAPQPAAGSTGGEVAGSPLVGTWLAEGDGAGGTIDKDYKYEFKADGTGVYTIFGDARPFNYKINGNTMDIVIHPGTSNEMEDTYTFELNGDTLTITTWIDEKVYVRQ